MLRRTAVLRPRTLVGALAVLLALPLVAVSAGSANADPSYAIGLTTVEVSPEDPTIDDTISVTVTVVPHPDGSGDPTCDAGVPTGRVYVRAAPTESDLHSPTVVLDPVILDNEGTATVVIDLDEELAFLDGAPGDVWLQATYEWLGGGVCEYMSQPSDAVHLVLGDTDPPPTPVAAPTTTVVSAPGTATVGEGTTLSAAVSPTAGGVVQFSVNGAPIGGPVVVSAGAASVEHAFTSAGEATVSATFSPADPAAYTGSSGSAVVAVSSPDAVSTTTEVTGPDTATAGEETTLTATVAPVEAAGTISFAVDGLAAGTADVAGGAASVAYTFVSDGATTVAATFTPAEPELFLPSSSSVRSVAVEPGATAASPEEGVDEAEQTMYGSTCAARGDRPGTAGRRADPGPIANLIMLFNFQPLGPSYLPISHLTPWFTNFFRRFEALNFFETQVFGLRVTIGPCGSIIVVPGSRRPATDRSEVTEVNAPCVVVGTGFECALPDLPANTEIGIAWPFSMPAEAAGRNLALSSALVGTDAITGEERTLGADERVLEVPRRTVLSAQLAPVPSDLTYAAHSDAVTYRLKVRNAGVVTADRVRACVKVGKGASVLVAKGAEVRGRQACWALPPLAEGASVSRRLTLVTPTYGRALGVTAVVTPRRSQAAPVRLEVRLPIT